MQRRFEFVEGSSAKFWSVAVTGPNVVIRFGRLGADGQSQTKPFANEAAAQQHADQLIRRKLAKGYRETATV